MPKVRELDRVLAHPDRHVSLRGERADCRYGDDELVALGSVEFENLSLARQHITKLPPLKPTLKSLSLSDMSLASLDGIEKLVGLQRLWLTELPELDWEHTCDLLAELPDLTELTLGSKRFTTLPANIVKLPSLVSLLFYETTTLDQRDAFRKLGKVATLRSLSIRCTPAVLADALEPLVQVESLQVLFSGHGEFPPSVGAMTNLQKLAFDRCDYAALPKSIGKLQKLRELDAGSTKLAALPDEICNCTALEVLDIGDTQVKALPDAIDRLANLRVLNARTKKLKTVPSSIGKLAKLRELWLPYAKTFKAPAELYALSLEVFHGPSDVEAKMTLAPAPTPQADRVWLHDAERLPADFGDPRELDVSLHEHTAPLPQLSALRRLQELTIDVGNLDDAFRRLVDAPQLVRLEVKGDHASLPESLGGLTQVKFLELELGSTTYPDEVGQLRELPASIGKLASLQSLVLTRAKLASLPATIGDLASLERFILDTGDMTELPPSIGKLKQLKTLSLITRKLARLPKELAQCTSLESLILSARWVEKFPIKNLDVIGKLPALRSLLLQSENVPIEKLLDALASTSIEELSLDDRTITKLPGIGRLTKLKKLELEDTKLKKVPAELKKCTELRWISVPLYSFDFAYRDKVKDELPKGRWKKGFRSSVTWFERSD